MKLSHIAALTGGALIGTDKDIQRVSTDTRTLRAGDLFVALRGEHFDAHQFLPQAAAAGADAALVEVPSEVFTSQVQVADSRHALGKTAAGWADQFTATRIGVTGNAGKTTVKEMIRSMLGAEALATQGNLNNDIGVPLTLLSLRAEHRYAVVELGASAPGEIAWTSGLLKPEIALITNVTGAHLEGFGTLGGIAAAKAEIFSGMAAGSIAIINGDDAFADYFSARAEDAALNVRRVSAEHDADYSATDIEADAEGVRFTLRVAGDTYPVAVPLPGRHQVGNALLALAAVHAAGVPLSQAIAKLAAMPPVPGRVNRFPCLGGTLIDDSYNANPGSVRAAIALLAQCPAPRMLVLGALGELGPQAADIHASLGRAAQEAGLDALVAVGEGARPAGEEFGTAARFAADHQAAVREALPLLQGGGTVLVKGSRSARMDVVVAALRKLGETH
ncbi:UDP-N-acetylmuramoyl-tripeptide--D-alanyl-D-alanine ligase [Alcanivorax quisquiliarum]|uniref:UDP-N-acetylmuramoyl-tripeptide--D-alanyl-D-alanine ligase n=1 Tax=Alcanivorax quisquiliarum TaxID=2933565 RepID=A0ABT0E875_9GAMM|nr:UDP-N-acetylmuramoyl-tripeptide--D-alanyl-D-alanine ligase [Alcanivorax quisquiliarum]MCK0537948.1 UDP-N-acetylmuramoyl-tripeptide--D-alanyl-D-alanine ligase [Alcanivorax quisquiliarum]